MKKIISYFLVSIFILQPVLASPGHGGESSGTKSKYPVVTVEKAKKTSEMNITINASGKILTKNSSDVFASREGLISYLYADLGDFVKKGQILAVLSPDREQSQLLAELTVKKSQLVLKEKRKNLFQDSTSLNPLQIQIETAEKNLQATKSENLAEIDRIKAQIKILESQKSVQSFAFENGMRDALDVFADFLFVNKSFLEREKILDPSRFRRNGFFINNSLARNEKRKLEREFIKVYKSFKTKETNIQEIIFLGNKFRILSTQAIARESEKEILKEIKNKIENTVDHLAIILNESFQIQVEIKTLKTEKKRILIANGQKKVVADNEIKTLEREKDYSFQELDWDMDLIKADIKAIQQQLGFGAYVRAPFSGRITARHLNVGDFVSGEKAIFSLVDTEHKFVKFSIAESEFPFVEKGKNISFAPNSMPSQTFSATIQRISPTVDTQTGTILVEADITHPKKEKINDFSKILVNMSVRVNIPIFEEKKSEKELFVIPEKALQVQKSFFGNVLGRNEIWSVDTNVEAQKDNIEIDFIYDGWIFSSDEKLSKKWVIIKSPVKLKENLEIETKLEN